MVGYLGCGAGFQVRILDGFNSFSYEKDLRSVVSLHGDTTEIIWLHRFEK